MARARAKEKTKVQVGTGEAREHRLRLGELSDSDVVQASLDGDPGAELAALRELSEFAGAGEDVPMERGPLMVALRKAEAACKRGGCTVEGG